MSIPVMAPIPPINRNAAVSFISAIIAVLSLCAIMLPLPFAALICYPPGILLAITSIVLGVKSQRQLRTDSKS